MELRNRCTGTLASWCSWIYTYPRMRKPSPIPSSRTYAQSVDRSIFFKKNNLEIAHTILFRITTRSELEKQPPPPIDGSRLGGGDVAHGGGTASPPVQPAAQHPR